MRAYGRKSVRLAANYALGGAHGQQKEKLTQYVVPTILGNCAYFLFTIIDGIFVGQGVGTDALGAVNLVWPFVMVLNAIIMLTVVGGVTVSAVRIGRGDIAGANQASCTRLPAR